jgi:hypothetical protein
MAEGLERNPLRARGHGSVPRSTSTVRYAQLRGDTR